MPESTHPVADGHFRDRSARLVIFGLLSVIGGSLLILLGLAHAAAWLLELGSDDLPAGSSTYLMGLSLYGLLGTAFVWTGTGSIRKRRWVRPIMLTLAWIWLLGGATVLPFLPRLLDDALWGVVPEPDPTLAQAFVVTKWLVVGVAALLGLVIPAVFVRVYRDPHVQMTCEVHDPRPAWTERCPVPVLGLSVGLAGCAALCVPLAMRPVVPAFGQLLTGPAGAAVLLGGALLCLYLAWATFRLRRDGWWGATALMLLMGCSILVTLHRVELVAFYRAMGYPEHQLELLRRSQAFLGAASFWLTAALTVVSLGYMVGVRRHFR